MFDLFQAKLPEFFLATQVDTLTDGLIRWRTIQNLRSKARRGDLAIPEGIFANVSPRKIMIHRDPFLRWVDSRATTSTKENGNG